MIYKIAQVLRILQEKSTPSNDGVLLSCPKPQPKSARKWGNEVWGGDETVTFFELNCNINVKVWLLGAGFIHGDVLPRRFV